MWRSLWFRVWVVYSLLVVGLLFAAFFVGEHPRSFATAAECIPGTIRSVQSPAVGGAGYSTESRCYPVTELRGTSLPIVAIIVFPLAISIFVSRFRRRYGNIP